MEINTMHDVRSEHLVGSKDIGVSVLHKLTEKTKLNLDKIYCQILIFSSYVDNVVPTDNQSYILDHVSSEEKELIVLENSYHVATLGNDANVIINNTIKFIEKYK